MKNAILLIYFLSAMSVFSIDNPIAEDADYYVIMFNGRNTCDAYLLNTVSLAQELSGKIIFVNIIAGISQDQTELFHREDVPYKQIVIADTYNMWFEKYGVTEAAYSIILNSNNEVVAEGRNPKLNSIPIDEITDSSDNSLVRLKNPHELFHQNRSVANNEKLISITSNKQKSIATFDADSLIDFQILTDINNDIFGIYSINYISDSVLSGYCQTIEVNRLLFTYNPYSRELKLHPNKFYLEGNRLSLNRRMNHIAGSNFTTTSLLLDSTNHYLREGYAGRLKSYIVRFNTDSIIDANEVDLGIYNIYDMARLYDSYVDYIDSNYYFIQDFTNELVIYDSRLELESEIVINSNYIKPHLKDYVLPETKKIHDSIYLNEYRFIRNIIIDSGTAYLLYEYFEYLGLTDYNKHTIVHTINLSDTSEQNDYILEPNQSPYAIKNGTVYYTQFRDDKLFRGSILLDKCIARQ